MIHAISEPKHGAPGQLALDALTMLDASGEAAILAYGVETGFAIYRDGCKKLISDDTGEVGPWQVGPRIPLSGKRLEEILWATEKGREAVERVRVESERREASLRASREREAAAEVERQRKRAELALEVERTMPKFTRGTVTLNTRDGAKEVPAEIAPCGLAIHPSLSGSDFTVTHVPSGMVVLSLPYKKACRQLVARIGSGCDWRKVEPRNASKVPESVLAIIRAVRTSLDGLASA